MYILQICGNNNRQLGTFVISQPRFTLGALVNPDSRDSDPARFLTLFGEDARRVAQASELTLNIRDLQADYPEVSLELDTNLTQEPEVDVDELVDWVHRTTNVNLDNLSDREFTLSIYAAEAAATRSTT